MAVRRGKAGAARPATKAATTKAAAGRTTRRAILAGGAASLAALGALRIALPPEAAPRFPDPAAFSPRLFFVVPVFVEGACDTAPPEPSGVTHPAGMASKPPSC